MLIYGEDFEENSHAVSLNPKVLYLCESLSFRQVKLSTTFSSTLKCREITKNGVYISATSVYVRKLLW